MPRWESSEDWNPWLMIVLHNWTGQMIGSSADWWTNLGTQWAQNSPTYNDPYGYNEYIGRLGLCRVGVVGRPAGHSVAGVAGWCVQEAAAEWIAAVGFEVQHKRVAEVGPNTEPVSDFVERPLTLRVSLLSTIGFGSILLSLEFLTHHCRVFLYGLNGGDGLWNFVLFFCN